MNGKFINWDKAQTNVMANGLHYGSGVFDGLRYYHTENGPVIFCLKDHIDRLFYSSSFLNMGMKLKYNENDISEAIQDLILKNMIKEGYVRIIFFWGFNSLSYQPQLECPLETAIATWEWDPTREIDSAKVKTSKFIKLHPKSTVTNAKLCGNYINDILANEDVIHDGYDEPLLLDYKGNVCEGAEKNIFFVKQGTVYTPPHGNIMPGITRKFAMELASDIGFKVVEKNFSLDELKTADEAFFTSTVVRVLPIQQIDERKFNPKKGPVAIQLQEDFEKIVRGKNPKYKKYLTFVRADV